VSLETKTRPSKEQKRPTNSIPYAGAAIFGGSRGFGGS
jgi:hypothetical protein